MKSCGNALSRQRERENYQKMSAPVILITHEFFPFPGGIAVYAREMALALAAQGRRVEVWCPPNPVLAEAAKEWPFAVVPIPGNRGTQDWSCRRATARLWRKRAADVREVELFLVEPGAILTAFYRWLFRLPAPKRLILTLHGSEILNFTRWPHRRWLFNRVLAKADGVSVLSRFNALLLKEKATVVPEKIRRSAGALRTDFTANLVAEEQGGNSAREAHRAGGSRDGLVTITCVWRIHPRKGQDALLEAVSLLPVSMRKRIRLQFVGRIVKQKYYVRLQKLAADSGTVVEFPGEIPDAQLPQVYAQSDIFALTSLPVRGSIEGFGLVYLEAGACGLPVLAHDTGGVSDAVIDGETGLLVPPGDRLALSAALRRLLEDGDLRRRLGENGRRHARSFSWARNAAQMFPA